MKNSDPVHELQVEIAETAAKLESSMKSLDLARLMKAVEEHYPDDMDEEAVGEDEVCPPVTWEIHADVGNAKILLEEACASLRKAAQLTDGRVRREWKQRHLAGIEDPPTRALFSFLLDQLDRE